MAGGPPPRPPPRWAWTVIGQPSRHTAATMAGLAVALAKADLILLDRFARTPAPRESVRRPRQVDHQGTELAGNARGVRDDPDLVAEFERIALHPRIRQLRGTAPLERPVLR